jgi:carbonic anhydrase/SulP family sulfate permease
MIFDVGLGDIFCTRTTGSVAVASTLGSLEYACAVAGAKVILVLGPTNNQAVRMAVDASLSGVMGVNGDCPNLVPILRDIQESVDSSWAVDWPHVSEEARRGRIEQVSRTHVQRTLRRIREQSPTIARLAGEGRIKLVGGMYDVRSGAVEFFE